MKICKEKRFENVDYIITDKQGRKIALWDVDWNGEVYSKGYYVQYELIGGNILISRKEDETHHRYRPIYDEDLNIKSFEEI